MVPRHRSVEESQGECDGSPIGQEERGNHSMTLYTTQEAAAELGLAPVTIERWCRRFGFETFGRDYVLTADQVEQIRTANHEPGRPRKD